MNHKFKKSKPDIIFGVHPVIEALDAGKEFDKIMILKGSKTENLEVLIDKARSLRVPVSRVPHHKLDRITRKNHQGVIAFVSPVSFSSLEHVIDSCFRQGLMPRILILDRVTDVRNFGAVVRTVECAGFHAVIIPERRAAQINADAVKTSAGALNRVPVCRTGNLYRTCRWLQSSGLKLVACTEKTDTDLYAQKFTEDPLAVIMGSEEEGIAPELLKIADLKVRIPMKGKISSLNVSVAAALLMYEILRQDSISE